MQSRFSSIFMTMALMLFVLMHVTPSLAQRHAPKPFLDSSQYPKGINYYHVPIDSSGASFYRDYAKYLWGKSMRNTPRGVEAVQDACTHPDSILRRFAPAFGMLITRKSAPQLYKLACRVIADGAQSVKTAKQSFMRKRPFVQLNETTPIPEAEQAYRTKTSFPSGHTARGWTLALILSEIYPARQDEILKAGYEYGMSRVIVGYHYISDVEAAMIMSSGAVARLHADEDFMNQLGKAKKEFYKLLSKSRVATN